MVAEAVMEMFSRILNLDHKALIMGGTGMYL